MALRFNTIRRFLVSVLPTTLRRTQVSVLITAACATKEANQTDARLDPIKFFQRNKLSHEDLIKQSCSLTVNSSTQLLTQVFLAISEKGLEYRKAMSELINLLDESLLFISNNTPLHEEIDDLILKQRVEIEDQRTALLGLKSLMEYVEKLVTSAAETAFLAGAEGASTLMCERLNSILEKIAEEHKDNKKVEDELLRLQESYVFKLAEKTKNSDDQSKETNSKETKTKTSVPIDLFNDKTVEDQYKATIED